MIIAPFLPDSTFPSLERINEDLTKQYGYPENKILNIDDFISLGRKVSGTDTSKFFKPISISSHILDLGGTLDIVPPMTAYMATTLNSTSDYQAALNISAYQSAKFWLNGKEIYNIEWKRGRNFYREDFIPITLKKGENFLFVKLSVSDKKYIPAQWKFEADISNLETSKKIFTDSYVKHFLRRSLIDKGHTLKFYTGPFSNDKTKFKILSSKDDSLKITGESSVDRKNGNMMIDLSKYRLRSGIYTCEMFVDKRKFSQDFFIGNIDHYLDSLKQIYAGIKNCSVEQRLNIDGIIRRLYMDVRRDTNDFDDQVEYWNRLRVPGLVQLEKAIANAKLGNRSFSPFFLKSYYSNFWQGYNYYSVHVPKEVSNKEKLPVFILLIDSETKTRNWEAHYRNTLSRWLLDTETIADELGFITVWTDCGGRIDVNNKLELFKEILANVEKDYPTDPEKIFIIGNCESTRFSLQTLQRFSTVIAGCGLINPNNVNSTYFDIHPNKDHKLTMVYAKNDEKIDREVSFEVYNKLKSIDPFATIYTDRFSSHGNAPSEYTKSLYVDLLSR